MAQEYNIPANAIDLSDPDVVGKFRKQGYPINDETIAVAREYRLPKLDDFGSVASGSTYEEKREGDMLEDELLAPGVISSVYISATAHAPKGAWPLGVAGVYAPDDMHLSQYAKAAKTREGFQRYLEEWVLTPRKSFSPA